MVDLNINIILGPSQAPKIRVRIFKSFSFKKALLYYVHASKLKLLNIKSAIPTTCMVAV